MHSSNRSGLCRHPPECWGLVARRLGINHEQDLFLVAGLDPRLPDVPLGVPGVELALQSAPGNNPSSVCRLAHCAKISVESVWFTNPDRLPARNMPIGVFQLGQGSVVPGRAPTATAEAIGLRALLFVLRNSPGAVLNPLGPAAWTCRLHRVIPG
jgi:hypothetical protein